jgi:hypothetical protein
LKILAKSPCNTVPFRKSTRQQQPAIEEIEIEDDPKNHHTTEQHVINKNKK